MLFYRDSITEILPNLKSELIVFTCQDGKIELKNNKWMEFTSQTEKFSTFSKEELQQSKKKKIWSKDGSKQPKSILLTDYRQAEVKFVIDYVFQKEVKLCRFLSILNNLESQLNGTVKIVQETPSPISTLSNELLMKILSYLSTQDLRGNVAKVSKHFKELSKSPFVHQVVTVNAGEKEAVFLRRATMMTELHLHTKDKSFRKLFVIKKMKISASVWSAQHPNAA